MEDVTLTDVARRIGVPADRLRRWVRDGVVPLDDGEWTPAAIAQARIVARMRARGHALSVIKEAVESGRLAYGQIEEMFATDGDGSYTLEQAAEEVGLEPALIERIWTAAGLTADSINTMTADDLELIRDLSAVLDAGLPLVAFLQLARVYGQAMTMIADAEVKLFHLYVHEPMIRDGRPGLEITEAMSGLVSDVLPLGTPIMERLHERALRHFMEQDVVGHLEVEAGGEDLGRVRVTIGFADLAGYTRMTEEIGEQEALDIVERFVQSVQETLPGGARVLKTIGDEVMIVGGDTSALVDWAVGFQTLQAGQRPAPRIGLHSGLVLYRDGDYYGRTVNLAARVGARAAAGEVLVTESIVAAAGDHLRFEPIGEVRLKGFNDATELFLASVAEP